MAIWWAAIQQVICSSTSTALLSSHGNFAGVFFPRVPALPFLPVELARPVRNSKWQARKADAGAGGRGGQAHARERRVSPPFW